MKRLRIKGKVSWAEFPFSARLVSLGYKRRLISRRLKHGHRRFSHEQISYLLNQKIKIQTMIHAIRLKNIKKFVT